MAADHSALTRRFVVALTLAQVKEAVERVCQLFLSRCFYSYTFGLTSVRSVLYLKVGNIRCLDNSQQLICLKSCRSCNNASRESLEVVRTVITYCQLLIATNEENNAQQLRITVTVTITVTARKLLKTTHLLPINNLGR